MTNILLPVDGSQQSIDGFKEGIKYAKKLDANVYLVMVLKDDSENYPLKERKSLFNSLENYASQQAVSLNKEFIYGEPRSQIARDLIDQWGINLIIMAATGKGRVTKMLVGSTTDYVIRNAKCDVLVVR